MFRTSEPQQVLFDAGGLLPAEKRDRVEKTWAGAFRRHALPILRSVEPEFADLFDPEEGRPNRPVELVLGVLILKEFSDLTDAQALDALEYDLRWGYAFQREPRELHLSQKTLHNFRTKLIAREKSKLAFRRVTDQLIQALGVKVDQQRLDSTHIVSDVAILTRLGLFCETIRLFLRELQRTSSEKHAALPEGLLARHAESSKYGDAQKPDRTRRLQVAARDLGRLVERFRNDDRVTGLEGWKLVWRLFQDHCRVTEKPQEPNQDDDDHGEGAVATEPTPPQAIRSDSLQTPHDPDATYSGHKGKGHEGQVLETCGAEEGVRLITEVEVTPSCQDDTKALVPAVKQAIEAGHGPREVVADTRYSSAANAAALSKVGVNLLAPVPGPAKGDLESRDFPEPAARCPEDSKEALEWQKQQEASPSFRKRYAIRAGIEATNSELKRVHGLGELRVRGLSRVKLAVYFKAIACNLKRALRAWLSREAEGSLTPA